MKLFIAVVVTALISSPAFAQTSRSASTSSSQPPAVDTNLVTPIGHEVNFGMGGYKYVEPGDTSISIHGPKFAFGYTGTWSLNQGQHWFAKGDARGSFGNTTYDGWCYPFLITPEPTSPNGYALDIGNASPCSESGDKDGYVEGRGLFGKDFVSRSWGVSPETGLGYRRLSNGIAGVSGYRTESYLYLPLGLTARTRVASHSTLSFNVEYDRLLHGWNTTRDSLLGGGDVPATATTPAFTIDGFSDVSFAQTSGWALRAGAKYQITKQWSLEPQYIHWTVSPSPVNFETATFTVNGITVQEQLGAYEPLNRTNEFVVKLGFHF